MAQAFLQHVYHSFASLAFSVKKKKKKVWTNKCPAAFNTKGHLHMLFKAGRGVGPGTAVKKSDWEEERE